MAKGNVDVGFAELHTQLRIISRLLAAQIKSTVGQQELIRILAGTGASHAEIADVTGTTTGTVGVTIQRLRKKASKTASAEDEAVESEVSANL